MFLSNLFVSGSSKRRYHFEMQNILNFEKMGHSDFYSAKEKSEPSCRHSAHKLGCTAHKLRLINIYAKKRLSGTVQSRAISSLSSMRRI